MFSCIGVYYKLFYCAEKVISVSAKNNNDPQVDAETIASDLGCASSDADGGWLFCHDVAAAAAGADALIILTEWEQYASLDWAALAAVMRHPAWLFDARGLADLDVARAAGLKVWRVGLGDPSLALAA